MCTRATVCMPLSLCPHLQSMVVAHTDAALTYLLSSFRLTHTYVCLSLPYSCTSSLPYSTRNPLWCQPDAALFGEEGTTQLALASSGSSVSLAELKECAALASIAVGEGPAGWQCVDERAPCYGLVPQPGDGHGRSLGPRRGQRRGGQRAAGGRGAAGGSSSAGFLGSRWGPRAIPSASHSSILRGPCCDSAAGGSSDWRARYTHAAAWGARNPASSHEARARACKRRHMSGTHPTL